MGEERDPTQHQQQQHKQQQHEPATGAGAGGLLPSTSVGGRLVDQAAALLPSTSVGGRLVDQAAAAHAPVVRLLSLHRLMSRKRS